jgi:hypothetical protein
VSQADIAFDPLALAIRTAVRQFVGHALEH